MPTKKHKLFFPLELPKFDADVIFWGDELGNLMRRIDVDGTSNADNFAASGSAYGSSVDEEDQKLFYTVYTLGRIRSADFDGTSNVTLFTDTGSTTRQLDTDSDFVYWGRFTGSVRLRKADKDGSNPADVLVTGVQIIDVQVDLVNGHLYFIDPGNATIKRCDLDGSNLTTVKSGISGLRAIALDVDAQLIWWTDSVGSMRRTTFAGVGNVLVHDSGAESHFGIAVDSNIEHIWWTAIVADDLGRVDFDGGNPNNAFVTAAGNNPFGLDVRFPQGSFYAKPSR